MIYVAEKLIDLTKSTFDAFGRVLLEVKDDGSKVYDPGIKFEKFTGLGTPEDFVEWLQQVEKISDYMWLDDKKIFNIATIRLTKKAGLWFDNLNARRVRVGKEKIVTWMTLKKKLRAKYIPRDYELECYLKTQYFISRYHECFRVYYFI